MSTGSYAVNKRGHKRKRSEMDESATPGSSAPFTRSATEPLRKTHCFFCQKDAGQNTFTVRTENSGKELRRAVEISQDHVMMTRL